MLETGAHDEAQLIARFKALFGCPHARIIRTRELLFLVLGWNASTRDDKTAQWFNEKNEPVDFEYVREQTVASGATVEELIKSAEEYKRLLGLNMANYLKELMK